MTPSLVTLLTGPYSPSGVYFEIYPLLGISIEIVKLEYSIHSNGILPTICAKHPIITKQSKQ
jgi:hypothetical protein